MLGAQVPGPRLMGPEEETDRAQVVPHGAAGKAEPPEFKDMRPPQGLGLAC